MSNDRPNAPTFARVALAAAALVVSMAASARAQGGGGDPIYDPRFAEPPGYDPRTDPNHPLSQNEDPGEEWDKPPSGSARPPVQVRRGGWDWGEVFYDGTYKGKLVITNACKTAEPVTITNPVPYLELPAAVMVPPGKLEVEATFKAPPQPPPPIRTGAPGEPGYGWVEPPHYDPQTGTSVRYPGEPAFHQPNFLDVKGKVTVWHPWADPCMPARDVYDVTAHVHFRPPPPDSPPGGPPAPPKPGEPPRPPDAPITVPPDPCVQLWFSGTRPPGFESFDCTTIFRGLALDLVMRALAPYVEQDAGAWGWLPSPDEIRTMGQEDLLALKQRADALADASPLSGRGTAPVEGP